MSDSQTNNPNGGSEHLAQELGSMLDRLASSERASADSGFESRLLSSVRDVDGVCQSLERLGAAERASADTGFEGRVLDAVGGAVAPGPIPIEQGRARESVGPRVLRVRFAAGLLMAGSVGVLTWVGLQAVSPELDPGSESTVAIERMSAEVIEQDLDLLWELVETDVGSLVADGSGSGLEGAMDDLALDLLRVDSQLDTGWGSLDSWVESLEEGAI